MRAKTLRKILRYCHISASVVVGTYLYAPIFGDPNWTTAIRWVVIPLLVVTGLGMWNQAALARLLKATTDRSGTTSP